MKLDSYIRSLFVATAMSACMFITDAREIYNSPAVVIDPGFITADTVPDFLTACDYHLRLEIQRHTGDASWSVTLGYNDGGTIMLDFLRHGSTTEEDNYAMPLNLSVVETDSAGNVLSVNGHEIVSNDSRATDAWSLKLIKNPADNEIMCVVGDKYPSFETTVKSDGLKEIAVSTKCKLGLARLSSFFSSSGSRETETIKTVEELDGYLSATANAFEAYWRYLDRDTDPRRLNLGGDYRLATVGRPDGSIEIIYLDGAKAGNGKWKPMMLKGLLTPTIFANHYDLTWFDANGSPVNLETSADIIDGAILRLNFPLHGGSVRFRKVPSF